jgi:uncharacterized protein YndB with AHSA1/START domain
MLQEILDWVAIVAGVLAAVVVAILLVGSFLPRDHVVSRSLRVGKPPSAVWRVITDYASVPAWHRYVLRVERLPERNGHEVWRETYKGGYPVQLETVEALAPHRLVRAIADANGPFFGRWEFTIAATEPGSRITLTEHGLIPNPFLRFLARLFMDPAAHPERYLKALAARFGEPAQIEEPASG